MNETDLEAYQNSQEIALFKEYRELTDVFKYVVETERRLYLANRADVQMHNTGGDIFFEINLEDAWVWDIYRSNRFLNHVRIYSFKDINLEENRKSE